MNIIKNFDLQFLYNCIYFLGIVFFGISIFDRNTPRGGGDVGPMMRGRGGVVSVFITIIWAVLGISFLGNYNFLTFNFKLLFSVFIGGLTGLILWKLFILYNRRIPMDNIELKRKIKRGDLIFWGISSIIIGLFFFFLGYALSSGNFFIGLLIYLISLPIITLIGARTNWA